MIAEKLLDYLRSATDDGEKAEVAQRIGELAERFAPDTQWFINTMNQVGSSLCLEFPSNAAAVMRLPGAVSIRICTPHVTSSHDRFAMKDARIGWSHLKGTCMKDVVVPPQQTIRALSLPKSFTMRSTLLYGASQDQ